MAAGRSSSSRATRAPGRGQPRSRSRAGEAVAAAIGGDDVRLIELSDPAIDPDEARARLAGSAVAVVASPTFKATYSGVLKAFLDGYDRMGLDRVVAVPLMVHGGPAHALAADVHLRPLLIELGATCPTPALSVSERELADPEPVIGAWVERSGWALRALAHADGRALVGA